MSLKISQDKDKQEKLIVTFNYLGKRKNVKLIQEKLEAGHKIFVMSADKNLYELTIANI